VAASEFHDAGTYTFEGKSKDAGELISYYAELVDAYPILSIEDPLDEEDWAGWQAINAELGERVQIVGDDLLSPTSSGCSVASMRGRPTRCW